MMLLATSVLLFLFINVENVVGFRSKSSFPSFPPQTTRTSTRNSLWIKTFHPAVHTELLRNLGQLYGTSSSSTTSKDSAIKIIIAGAPASGKGTQCSMITSEFGCVHLSTGDILRAAVKECTPLGIKAKEFMDSGRLVPDELIIDVICSRLLQEDCMERGWLLDGFPRTAEQAFALQRAGMEPDHFILLDVPEDVLVDRVEGRRTDPVTGKIYHMKYSPPETEEIARRVTQRSDDTAEKIVTRYREFQSHIDAVKSFYDDKTIWVDGTIDKEDVSSCIRSALNSV